MIFQIYVKCRGRMVGLPATGRRTLVDGKQRWWVTIVELDVQAEGASLSDAIDRAGQIADIKMRSEQ